ncbi:MAG: helix-turn-helix domain-containing protein [Clostridia bacterium]|nr:helix-turn-helix domain-containing protein [Clostridia bacterium]
MTLEEIRRSEAVMLLPKDVAPVLGMHPYSISLLAKQGRLPFPYIRSGNRTKIPREAFLEWLRTGR